MVQGFESRHPAVQHLLSMLNPDHLSHADRVAQKFLGVAADLANVLPDGPALQEVLSLVAKASHRALEAVAEVEGGQLGDQAAAAPALDSAWHDMRTGAEQAAAPQLVPGRDHPITEAPPAPAQEAATAPEGAGDQGAAIAAQAPAQEAAGTVPADSTTPAVEGTAGSGEETGDSGPAGAAAMAAAAPVA